MSKLITSNVKEAVSIVTQAVLEETKEVNFYRIKELLEKEYKIKFFNMEVLQKLIKEALDNIVFIYC